MSSVSPSPDKQTGGGDATAAHADDTSGGAKKSSSTGAVVFPVGRTGKRELGRALKGAASASNPQKTIETFQKQHSLHSMLARAFGTQPRHEIQTRSKRKTTTVESLDSDSVMEFLSHLGVSQYQVHKRISDTLLKKLEDEIKRSSNDTQPLLDLLQNSWASAVALPELRPIIWAVLRQLGEQTPKDVLLELARRADEKDDVADNKDKQQTLPVVLKHAEIFRPLPVLLKKLVWESDWYNRIPAAPVEGADTLSPTQFLQQARGTLWFQTISPTLAAYCQNATLVQAANRMLGVGPRERKVVTTQRLALTPAAAAAASTTGTATLLSTTTTPASSAGTAAALLRGATGTAAASSLQNAASSTDPPSGKAIAQLRVYLSDSGGGGGAMSSSTSSSSSTTYVYRPKLLNALLSILIAQHGAVLTGGSASSASGKESSSSQQYHGYLGGATYLHCTLVADLLLSAGGPLPKAYQHVISLARLLDECVNEGTVSDKQLVKIQAVLKLIFGPPDTLEGDKAAATTTGSAVKKAPEKTAAEKAVALGNKSKKSSASYTPISSALKRQLNRILTSSMDAMKLADPQSLFLNDVTDEIAPGYSKIIKRPMCISQMEKKVHKNAYEKLDEFISDVKLMFQNCVEYNKGPAGQWFRGEAKRQKKVFLDEILPQARKLYQSEIVNRKTPLPLNDEEDKKAAARDRKRKAEALSASLAAGGAAIAPRASAVQPLPAMTKKRKKDKETEYLPSMPALALMLLADPFVVRIILARVLRELRASVAGGGSVPAASAAIPSLLQLLHMAHWSSQICAIRGKRYFAPSAGVQQQSQDASQAAGSDPTTLVPYATLRQDTPLVLRLLLEADLDKRMVVGYDLYDASQSSMTTGALPTPINVDQWGGVASVSRENTKERTYYMQVAISLLQVALVHVCQPKAPNDTSLAVTFPKFASALEQITAPAALMGDTVFFKCLIYALLQHKQRLKPAARDAIVHSWMGWLRVGSPKSSSNSSSGGSSSKKKKKRGCMTMAVHECLIMLLNDWSSIGNLLLPRDTLLQFAADIVQTANETEVSDERKFAHLWNLSSSFQESKDEDGNSVEPPPLVAEFHAVYRQYERLLKNLPAVNATQWKEQVGIGGQQQPQTATKDASTKETEISSRQHASPMHKDNDDNQKPAATTNNKGDAGGVSPVDMVTD